MGEPYPFSAISPESTTGIDRRRFLHLAGGVSASAVAVGALGSLAACAAAPTAGATAAGAAGSAFNPAITGWLSQIAVGIAANEIGDLFKGAVSKRWQAWQKNVKNNAATLLGDDWWYTQTAYGHAGPPTVLIAIGGGKDIDPMRDRLYAAVENGESAVIFDAWAWQGLSLYVHDLSNGKQGEDLNRMRMLSALSLVPSGTRPRRGQSPKKTVDWMTYQTRNGVVEIARIQEAGGAATAIVTAEGVPNADGKPTVKQYKLPTQAAGAR
jgi:hypothetical protein